jgi:hypothetical protein
MSEKPILFSTPMVKAILDGKKTMTRRVIKPQPLERIDDSEIILIGNEFSPYKIGDILWVRETWNCISYDGKTIEKYWYKADTDNASEKWRPSIFMPREAARIFLKVTGVMVERLQDITEDDAKKEGFSSMKEFYAREKFLHTWDALNAKRGHGWDANPWVWVIQFEAVK